MLWGFEKSVWWLQSEVTERCISSQYKKKEFESRQCHKHPWLVAKVAKLAVFSGWKDWHNGSSLSITVTRVNRGRLLVHVCRSSIQKINTQLHMFLIPFMRTVHHTSIRYSRTHIYMIKHLLLNRFL